LLNATDKLWWRALVAVAYGSGLRRREMLNLTWMDVDFEEQQIRVEPKNSTARTIEWEPKDHEQRVVPMSDDATQLLADLQAESKVGFPYIFITPRRFALIKKREATGHWHARSEEINNLSRDFDVIQRRANVRRCTLHDLRRSAITNWAQKLPIQVVQQLPGHSNINTTRKYYIAVRPEDIALANEIVSSIRTAAGKKRLTQN
jgi:integrase